jgi:hypothetical protein
MAKVKFVKRTNMDGSEVEHAIIDKGNGEFISMPKETYEAQFGITPTPIVTEDV